MPVKKRIEERNNWFTLLLELLLQVLLFIPRLIVRLFNFIT